MPRVRVTFMIPVEVEFEAAKGEDVVQPAARRVRDRYSSNVSPIRVNTQGMFLYSVESLEAKRRRRGE